MAAVRLSRLQQRLLRWCARPSAQGPISHRVRRLEHQGLVVMGRTPGGKAASLVPTADRSPEGQSMHRKGCRKEEETEK